MGEHVQKKLLETYQSNLGSTQVSNRSPKIDICSSEQLNLPTKREFGRWNFREWLVSLSQNLRPYSHNATFQWKNIVKWFMQQGFSQHPPKKQPFRVSVAACSDLEIERAIYAVFFSSWGVHRIFSRKNRTWRRSGIKTLGPTSMEWFTVIDYMIIIFALQSCSGFGSGCLFLVLFSIWVICTYTIISLSWIKFSFGRFPFLKPKN